MKIQFHEKNVRIRLSHEEACALKEKPVSLGIVLPLANHVIAIEASQTLATDLALEERNGKNMVMVKESSLDALLAKFPTKENIQNTQTVHGDDITLSIEIALKKRT